MWDGRGGITLMGSVLRDENFGAQSLRGGLAQHLPCHRRVAIADGGEVAPEFALPGLLHARGRHVLGGALIALGLNSLGLLSRWQSRLRRGGLDVSAQAIL